MAVQTMFRERYINYEITEKSKVLNVIDFYEKNIDSIFLTGNTLWLREKNNIFAMQFIEKNKFLSITKIESMTKNITEYDIDYQNYILSSMIESNLIDSRYEICAGGYNRPLKLVYEFDDLHVEKSFNYKEPALSDAFGRGNWDELITINGRVL